MDVFGSGFDTPGSERFGGQSRLEPVREGLGGRELVALAGVFPGHRGDSEKSARVEREGYGW